MNEIKAWREKLNEGIVIHIFCEFLPLEQYLLAEMLGGRKNWQVKRLWTARFREFVYFESQIFL